MDSSCLRNWILRFHEVQRSVPAPSPRAWHSVLPEEVEGDCHSTDGRDRDAADVNSTFWMLCLLLKLGFGREWDESRDSHQFQGLGLIQVQVCLGGLLPPGLGRKSQEREHSG